MTPRTVLALLTAMGLGLLGCQSSSTSCSFASRVTWTQVQWPKFRHDLQNTGTVTDSTVFMNVSANVGQKAVGAVFPPLQPPQPPKQPFAASPVINNDGSDIYIGSTDGVLYKLNATDLTPDTAFQFSILDAITSTALVARLSNGSDALFVGGGSGEILALSGVDGLFQSGSWPVSLGSFISASPTLNPPDGTVYLGSLGGLFTGVCSNGVERFGGFLVGPVQSSAANGPDGTLYFGADDHQLRAVASTGVFQWTFSASAPIVTAPVVEVENTRQQSCTAAAKTCPFPTECVDDATDDTTRAVCISSSTSCSCRNVFIYVADLGGRIFKVQANGQPDTEFTPPSAVGPFSSSPALAGDRLYLGSDDGMVYAIDKNTGSRVWTFATGGAVASSPAVATDGTQALIVVGSDDGNVYFIRDDGSMAGPPIDIGAAVRSSPAIGNNGTIYVGADDGRVYAIPGVGTSS